MGHCYNKNINPWHWFGGQTVSKIQKSLEKNVNDMQITIRKLYWRLEKSWPELCNGSKWHCNHMEDRKYISNELVDFPEEMIRQNVGRAKWLLLVVPDKAQIEREKLEKEPFSFQAESRGNIPNPESAELENKTVSHSQTLQPIKKILKVNKNLEAEINSMTLPWRSKLDQRCGYKTLCENLGKI